ncbi:MAG TPA: pentapeptide repeat-containing protein [Methanocorpusculum sp.]|nr:pentapeptide repeat-containing protein [Methanocorpusculum sp.]
MWLFPICPQKFVHLEGVNLSRANLERANLEWAHLRKANLFMGANLEWADLRDTFLFGANLREANLERAIIRFAILLRTKCCLASVDGGTLITGCKINDKTDFTGVGLSGTRVDPELHTRLLRNIRKMQWEEWYAKKKILTFFKQFLDQVYVYRQ